MAQKNQDTSSSEVEYKTKKPKKIIQGFEWSKLPSVNERLEGIMWNMGLLKKDDVDKKPTLFLSALNEYHKIELSIVRKEAREYKGV